MCAVFGHPALMFSEEQSNMYGVSLNLIKTTEQKEGSTHGHDVQSDDAPYRNQH